MARAIENAYDHVFHGLAERSGNGGHVLGRRLVNTDYARTGGPGGDLVHVGVGRVQQRSSWRHRNGRERVGLAERAQIRALEGIDRNIKFFPAKPQLLADEEHGSLVALAFADDDPPAYIKVVEGVAHSCRGRLICRRLIASPDPVCRSDGRFLSDGEHIQKTCGMHGAPSSGVYRPHIAAILPRRYVRMNRTAKWASEDPASSRVATHERPAIGTSLNLAPASLERNDCTTPLFSSFVTVHVA